ncbi:DUF72 domain-containing protein [Terriglobus roseus]|uniref:Uncharacterized conserved protein YecE, DUF72 family n=1 Tax=Terriglobus roseus TaxID=392734 RepID=A0A1H4NI73_9BACT|nr:DUF72 domain-containing protein [Terriglobus roseus]SEB94927.1 Uncharacterized conserved protein YecE, DUF72 family [Terriglobus roseus]
MSRDRVFIGTAGWSVPRAVADQAPGEGSHLHRYARQLKCAEINSSFYRPHKQVTYSKWAAAVPSGFRFAVKMPRALTHEGALAPDQETLQRFLDETSALGDKRGPVLLQLPPKRALDIVRASNFLTMFRACYAGPAALEPRHVSWFTEEANALLRKFAICRVAADPLRAPEAMTPAGDSSLIYYRLHGSPRTYHSSYDEAYLVNLSRHLATASELGAEAWCIFDNTASGAALGNALQLRDLVRTA